MKTNIEKVKMAMLAVQRYPWEQGVCMQALFESGDVETAVAMAHDAVLRQQKDGRLAVINANIAVTDPAANGIVVKKAYDITGDSFYMNGAEKMLDYLMTKAPRTDTDILCHNEISFHEGFSPDQIWADSIYMAPPFLAEMGNIKEAYKQISGMHEYLLDSENGLLRHIYDAETKKFVRDKLWATGNGWALLGMAAVTETAIKENESLIAENLCKMSKNLLDNLLKFQLPESYLKYADKILLTMEQYVDSYGIIHGVCGCPDFISEGTSAESMAAYIMMHAWKEKMGPSE